MRLWVDQQDRAMVLPVKDQMLRDHHRMSLLMKIISDITYTVVDPRIDFETRE